MFSGMTSRYICCLELELTGKPWRLTPYDDDDDDGGGGDGDSDVGQDDVDDSDGDDDGGVNMRFWEVSSTSLNNDPDIKCGFSKFPCKLCFPSVCWHKW